MMRRKRCAIFFHDGYLGVSPTVVNFAKSLAASGYDVTIYARPTSYPETGDLGARIEVVRLSSTGPVDRFVRGLVRRLSRVTGNVPVDVLFAAQAAACELWRQGEGAWPVVVYVGVDPYGATAAALASALVRTRYVYLSLELKINAADLPGLAGRVARDTYRNAAAVLVQGTDRLDTLTSNFSHRHPHVFILPNSPSGGPTRPERRDDFLRTRLGIEMSRRIVLQAGMIGDITCSARLAASFSGIDDWALVLHERHARSQDEPYMRELRRINGDNLFLSLDPVPYSGVGRVFASADVGLVFYQPAGPDDRNYANVSSSGKLTHYLQHGTPILVSDLPALTDVVRSYRCGVVIRDPGDPREIRAALRYVSERYDEFSANATRCFEERFDFSTAMGPITAYIDALCKPAPRATMDDRASP